MTPDLASKASSDAAALALLTGTVRAPAAYPYLTRYLTLLPYA